MAHHLKILLSGHPGDHRFREKDAVEHHHCLRMNFSISAVNSVAIFQAERIYEEYKSRVAGHR